MENQESKYTHMLYARWIAGVVILFLVVVSIYFLVLINGALQGYYRTQAPQTISVSGEGKELAKPDIATFSVGVVKSNMSLLAAQQAATNVMNNVSDTLRRNGVTDEDQKTTLYSITPQYDYTQYGRRFLGYEVRQNIEVKIRDLGKVGTIIAAVSDAGANDVGSLSFTVDKPKQIEERAREEAIADAQVNAEKLAASLGVKLVKVTGYSESSGGTPVPLYARADFGVSTPAVAPPPIPAGENEVRVNATITYEIR